MRKYIKQIYIRRLTDYLFHMSLSCRNKEQRNVAKEYNNEHTRLCLNALLVQCT